MEALICAAQRGSRWQRAEMTTLTSPLLCLHGGEHMEVLVSSSVFSLSCKRMMQAARQLIAQDKMTQFCFRSCLYFTSFVSEHLINKSKWTITSSKQACSEIPETIKRWGKQFIASYAWILGILDILSNTPLYSLKLV